MRRIFILLVVFLWQINCFSQKDSVIHRKQTLLDTLHNAISASDKKSRLNAIKILPTDTAQLHFLRDSIKIITPKLISLEARMDSRASSFQGTEVNIYGYYVGAMIKQKLSLGLAYYRLSTVLPAQKTINGVNTGTSLVVNCGSINSELIYLDRRFFSLGFPLEFAFGQYNLTSTNTDNNTLISQQVKFLAFANFGLSGTFKPFKFVGLKVMAGYRKSIYPEEKKFEFNGVYSSLGLFVDLADILSNIKMYKLMKKYGKVKNALSTKVDLFTD
ncbi:MAG: hypothetical protein ABI388_13295 [Bacteroidia bacterium]